MTFSSKKLRYSIAVVIFLALTLASLRVYAYSPTSGKKHCCEQNAQPNNLVR